MEQRIQIDAIEPQAYKAMFAMGKYLNQNELSETHKGLIKMRASLINKCAFCIDLHTLEALKQGETEQRIRLLPAWQETDLFTEEEQILLKVTEEVTLISHQGLSEETYKKALAVFGEKYLAQMIMEIIAINSWNRIAVSTNKFITK
ncbi:carboxymuconolactone decarboxylase family protein [Sinomicrobium weinanense]|uniref:Carboxymuconolactone decarboxylase family protein n=1 Tax=Sinomicrobium weinanense TaxID=2842200 RepID=A0A926JPE0_9FLAO|nr:carboxymuconolactone decarboxylase family protein [Sinomicrobium weinanense]MBC9794868.1 carboxymuconolactone decarboxylase family protein [Sinomicrobium weinanense]MBU3125639.1 carboxymuconolactone decarboxylase family protein [Sinomicrobium weinanense]